uniref:Endonuclease/exonuclease/phosphatase domain-containing protein n=1 Tax=Photinus pyralis TaxID=7054 RepID=A0A1Y1MGS2_PHOPY
MNKEKAHLRELVQTNQCELIFPLHLTKENSGIVWNGEIHSVRACTDVMQSFLSHTQRKIVKLLETKGVSDIEVPVRLTVNGTDVKGDTTCKQFVEKPKKNLVFTIFNQSFEVIINAPLVQQIIIPRTLYVHYSYQPLKFKSIYTEKELSDFIWCTSTDCEVWTEVCKNFRFKPSNKDLNKHVKLKCIPRNVHSTGPPFEVISQTTVMEMAVIPQCPFDDRHKFTKSWLTAKNEMRVVSYNILSNLYSEKTSPHPHCTLQALSIDYRKQLILKELLGYKADILCLQEVDHHIFVRYLKPKLSKIYKGLFHKKGYRISEGLACFFNTEKFKLLDTSQLVFCEELRTNTLFKRTWNLVRQCNTLKDCIIKQPTSLQVTVLKVKHTEEIIIVANTHLYYHSEASQIRLLQTSIALDYIKDVYNQYKRTSKSRVSVLFCGDFNSVPSSAVYEFILHGVVQHSFQVDIENEVKSVCLSHPFQFASAYGTPKYTNYTEEFKGCLDYIFYDRGSFTVLDCVPLPSEEILAEKVALPNDVFPSDHLALIANLRLT